MKHRITSVSELGAITRAARKSSGVRLDDLATLSGFSKQFVNDIELGKEGVQLGKVLQVLSQLGVHVYVDVPPGADDLIAHSRDLINRTKGRRAGSNAMVLPMVKVTASGSPTASKPVSQAMLDAIAHLRATSKKTLP